jgi:hypothetical protein
MPFLDSLPKSAATIGRGETKLERMRYLIATVAAAAALLSGLVYLYFVDPAEARGFPVCPIHYFTGLHCPGCGTSRALHQLLHGRLLAALRLNSLTVFVMPVLLIVFGRNAIAACRGTEARWHRPNWVPARWPWAVVILVIGYGVLRNVPYWPFALLAPH